jgi:hypothetical protein
VVVGLFIVLCVIGAARIVATYSVFSQTTDEPAHIATGMEWLQRGTFTFEPLHPPLARVAVALGPFLAGRRLADSGKMWKQGDDILMAPGRYQHVLALARLGVLPFLLLAAFVVWNWTRRRFGDAAAILAAGLFTTTPPVLAHAGLATTDMPLTATVVVAFAAFTGFLLQPTAARATALGCAVGLATLAKFSALLFLPACAVALLAWRWLLLRRRRRTDSPGQSLPWWRGLAVFALSAALTVWAGYRFAVGPITRLADRPHVAIDRVVGGSGSLHDVAYTAVESFPVPAPELFHGLALLSSKGATGHEGYLLGQTRQTGWWYYFPVALGAKTPIPFLILIAFGVVYLLRRSWREVDWVIGAPVVAAAAILLVCLPSRINIGLRHILPIYPFLAVIGGVGALRLWTAAKSKVVAVGVVALMAWQLIASIHAHPDYLAYFNELASQHPEEVLIDSDLDWGQDLWRLSAALRERHIDALSLVYAGSPGLDLHQFGLPPFHALAPYEHATGWVAISLLRLKAGGLGYPVDSYRWLDAYKPQVQVGRSIWLYDVPVLRPAPDNSSITRTRAVALQSAPAPLAHDSGPRDGADRHRSAGSR